MTNTKIGKSNFNFYSMLASCCGYVLFPLVCVVEAVRTILINVALCIIYKVLEVLVVILPVPILPILSAQL